ncbi:MAG: hypothetical protein HY905_21780 [Deltaproteobacteria bacterium]|nr:hypothetical protein [Deltaproteobacteria bacterium]
MQDGDSASNDGSDLDLVAVERRAAASWARGATRRVRVTYGCQCGSLAGAEIVSVLNVADDPLLAEDLVSGALNRATCPACGIDHLLRAAVVVHDPQGHRVVICAGEGDRHRAVDLLVRYLEGLRDQPGDSVPAYALSPEIAFGRVAWREHLSAPARVAVQAVQAEIATRRKEVEDKSKTLEQARAKLAAHQRDLETARAAIDSQGHTLSDRTAVLQTRETELDRREHALAEARGRADDLDRRFRTEQTKAQRLREEADALRSALEDREVLLRRREEDLAAAEEQLARREASFAATVAATIQAAANGTAMPERPVSEAPPPPASEPIPPAHPPAKTAPASAPTTKDQEPTTPPVPVPSGPITKNQEPTTPPVPVPSGPITKNQEPTTPPFLPELPGLLDADDAEEVEPARPSAQPLAVTEADVLDERALEPDTEVSRAPAKAPVPPAMPLASPAAMPQAAKPLAAAEEPVLEVGDSDLMPADAAIEEVEPDELEEAEAVPEKKKPAAPAHPPARPKPPEPAVPESLRAWFASGVPTAALVEGGEVHLYRKPALEDTASMRRGLSLGCRLFVHDDVPWLQLVLADAQAEPPELVELWLVHFELVDDAAVVRLLAERFAVQVVEVDDAGRMRWTAELTAPLARNVTRIRQAAVRLDAKKKGDRAAAFAAARDGGAGWLDRAGMPSFESEEVASTLGAIQQALVELTPWMTEEAEERLLVERSVSAEAVDGYRRRVLGAAAKAGLWLPPDLARRAIQDGTAPSAERLVAQLTENFFRLTGRRHDLDRDAVGRNWLYLTRDAERLGLVIDSARLAWIQAFLREGGPPEAGTEPAAGPETAKGDPELLLRWLVVPRARAVALAELLRGRLSDYVPELAVAFDGLAAADLLDSLVEVRANEDLIADVFMAGLDAHRRPLRIASATGLGKLALRRAIVPLVHLLLRADSDDWRFVGTAIASYGATGVKAVEPMLADPRGKEDRLAWTLACFHGAAAERHVQTLTESTEILTAAIARRSTDWRADVEAFRARLKAAEDPEALLVALVRRLLADEEAPALREAVAGLRSKGGMDF